MCGIPYYRPPFDTNSEYVENRNTVVGWGKELISLTQVEKPIENQEKIKDLVGFPNS